MEEVNARVQQLLAEERAEFERARVEERAEYEKKLAESERKLTEERKQVTFERRAREEAEAETERERRVRGEAERREIEADTRRREAEFREKEVRDALHAATKIDPMEALSAPLPQYSAATKLTESSSTRCNPDSLKEGVGGPGSSSSGGGGGAPSSSSASSAPNDPRGEDTSLALTVGYEAAPGVRLTTTKAALGVKSLSVHARASSVLLSTSEKACTFRYTSGELDLVWRQYDVYGLPKHFPDYAGGVLQEMISREIRAYMHLRDYWGVLCPRFVYCGHDFFVLWAFVVSYEGVDLRARAKEHGGLTEDVKRKARAGLIQLHALGVIHGDVALRNILFRERDSSVLWIDFEASSIFLLGDEGERGGDFTRKAELELRQLEDELARVPTIVPSSPETHSPPPAKKRTKGELDPQHLRE